MDIKIWAPCNWQNVGLSNNDKCQVRINKPTPQKVRSTLEGISWISPVKKRPLWISLEIPLLNSIGFHEIVIGFDWGNLKDPIGIPLNSIEKN